MTTVTDNDKHFDLMLEAARRTANEWFASFDRHHRTAPRVAEEALAKKKELDAAIEWFENDSVGAECSRLESDHLDIHDALVAAGLEGAINPSSIIERIELLAGRAQPAIVLCVRHPDHESDFEVHGNVQIIDVDLGSSFDSKPDTHAQWREWSESVLEDVEDLPEDHPIRQSVESLVSELEPDKEESA